MITRYDWSGGNEAMVRFGPADGPVVVALLPPFEEANRTRTFMVTMLRALETLGVGAVLPDIPGQGESEKSIEETSITDWYKAIASVCHSIAGGCYTVSVRSGALLEGAAGVAGRWRLAPQDGAHLLHELGRTAKVAAAEGGSTVDLADIDLPGPPMEIAGNRLPRAMLRDLRSATFAEGARTVRLSSDRQPADRHVEGPPLWRRAEPGNDTALAELLAHDIADWIRACEG